MNHSRLTLVAIQAALQAGEVLRKGFGTQFKSYAKTGKQNLVTEYDTLIEDTIISTLTTHFPDHAFLAEESGKSGMLDSPVVWIIDPLDGTVNFANNIPICSISIAAMVQKEIVSGVVYQPLTHELFVAEQKQGAYLNGKPLRVSSIESLDQSILATGFPYNVDENPLHCIDLFSKITRLGVPIRRLGSAAIDLAYVAAGRFDAYWEVTLNPWDYAAGKLLVEEAGGKVTHYDGSEHAYLTHETILASNGRLHPIMIEKLHEV